MWGNRNEAEWIYLSVLGVSVLELKDYIWGQGAGGRPGTVLNLLQSRKRNGGSIGQKSWKSNKDQREEDIFSRCSSWNTFGWHLMTIECSGISQAVQRPEGGISSWSTKCCPGTRNPALWDWQTQCWPLVLIYCGLNSAHTWIWYPLGTTAHLTRCTALGNKLSQWLWVIISRTGREVKRLRMGN